MTSAGHQELEGLEDMLSRIAMETVEIKHLEQQLTEGQILVNEALQLDLQGIISGIQDSMGGLRQQVSQAQHEARCLGAQNHTLQHRLQAAQLHCRRLETEARTHREQVQTGLDRLLEALFSGQDLSSHGPEDALSGRLQQMYQDIQRYVAEQVQQNQDQQIQGEKWREELKEMQDGLQNSQAQVQHLQQMMADMLSSRQTGCRSDSQRHTDLRIRWTTQQLRALSDTLEHLEPPQEKADSGVGLQYPGSPEGGRSAIYSGDGNYTDPVPGPPAGGESSQAAPCGAAPPPACHLPEHAHLIDRLEEERKILHLGMKQLRSTNRQNRCVCVREARCVRVCEDVQCVERTLLKRRAELRQADRRLLDAHSYLQHTTHKVRCVQKQLVTSRSELEELNHRLQEGSACLLQTIQQLWEMEELQQARRRRERP